MWEDDHVGSVHTGPGPQLLHKIKRNGCRVVYSPLELHFWCASSSFSGEQVPGRVGVPSGRVEQRCRAKVRWNWDSMAVGSAGTGLNLGLRGLDAIIEMEGAATALLPSCL